MKNKPVLLKGFFLGIGIAALIAGAILGWPYLMKLFSSTEKNISSKYGGNLYLLEHDYVYAVTLDIEGSKNTIFMVKGEHNQFDVWKPGQNANRIYATAFMIDSSGVCITSGYAVTPWYNMADYNILTGILEKEFDLQGYQIAIKGYSLRMVLKKYDQQVDDTMEVSYKPFGYTGKDADDLVGFIQKAGNDNISSFQQVKFPESINGDKEQLYLVGHADQQASTHIPLKAVVTSLDKNAVTNTRYFNFREMGKWLPEGAPVFNRKGELIGVYSGYNYKVDSINNILSSPIRKSTDLAVYIQTHAQIDPDESFIFLDRSEAKLDPTPIIKDWKTVIELKAPSSNAYDSHVFYGFAGVNAWDTPDFKIDMKNTRLRIKIDKLVKSEEYKSDLKITILEKNDRGEKKEETGSFLYDQEGYFIENLWKFDGIFKIYVEGMDGCKFKIELQVEK